MQNDAETSQRCSPTTSPTHPSSGSRSSNNAGSAGAALIQRKLQRVKDYTRDSWKLDLDDLRDVVLRRGGQIATLDLTKLN